MRISIKVLMVFLFLVIVSSSQNLPRTSLAVIDFDGRRIDKDIAATLSDRFRQELSKAGSFTVMERSRMNIVFQEQNFQRSECDEQCAVQAGQIMAVQKIVTGAASKVGKLYTVNVKMIDVATGRIDVDISEDCDCSIEKLLTEKMAKMAFNMSEYKLSGNEIVSGNTHASIHIETNIPGAYLYVDGDSLSGGITPITLNNLSIGKHTITAFLGDLQEFKEIFVQKGQNTRITMNLHEKKTLLNVVTDPSNAELWVNKKVSLRHTSTARTPAVLNNISNTVQLTLFKAGFRDTTISFALKENEINLLNVKLDPVSNSRSLQQLRIISQRKKSYIGKLILISSVAFFGVGTFLYYQASDSWNDADNYKKLLESSDIKGGSEYDSYMGKNKKAVTEGNQKATTAAILGGVGFIGLSIGIVLNF